MSGGARRLCSAFLSRVRGLRLRLKLRRAIERFIEDPLAEGVLRGDFEISKTVKVSVAEDTEGFTFAQEAKAEPASEPEPETATATEEG